MIYKKEVRIRVTYPLFVLTGFQGFKQGGIRMPNRLNESLDDILFSF